MTLGEFHGRLGNMAFLYFLLISIWGWVRYFRKQDISPNFWGALAIAEALILVQVLLGGYLWIIGARPGRDIHMLYGALVPLLIPGAYLYTRGRAKRAEVMIYAMVTIVGVALIMRAVMTSVAGG